MIDDGAFWSCWQPLKCTDTVFEAVVCEVTEGRSITDACKLVPVSRSAFYAYLERQPDKKGDLKKATHTRDLSIAEEARQTIRDAFDKDWKSAAWWLERNFPALYGMNPALRTGQEESEEEQNAQSQANLDRALKSPSVRRTLEEAMARTA